MMVEAMDASGKSLCLSTDSASGAVILATSKTYSGTKFESGSEHPPICAEAGAISRVLTDLGPDVEIDAIVIYSPTEVPTLPCEACRDALFKLGPKAELFVFCDGDQIVESTVKALATENA
jgi:cytidine deaminase